MLKCLQSTFDGDTFSPFTKNTWIGDPGALCHITNNYTILFDVIDINKLIQGSSGIMPAAKKDKLHVNIQQVVRTEWIHTLRLVKFCPKAGANLFSLTCELLQGKKISSDHQNNIVVSLTNGNIILDCQIKTHDGWVARVEFLQKTSDKRAQSATAP